MLGSPSREATTLAGSTTGEATRHQPVAVDGLADDAVRRPTLTVSVTGRTPTTTQPRVDGALRRTAAMNAGGVIGHSGSCSTNGSSGVDQPLPRRAEVDRRHARPRPAPTTAAATSASPWISAYGSEPAVVVEHGAERGRRLVVVVHTPRP